MARVPDVKMVKPNTPVSIAWTLMIQLPVPSSSFVCLGCHCRVHWTTHCMKSIRQLVDKIVRNEDDDTIKCCSCSRAWTVPRSHLLPKLQFPEQPASTGSVHDHITFSIAVIGTPHHRLLHLTAYPANEVILSQSSENNPAWASPPPWLHNHPQSPTSSCQCPRHSSTLAPAMNSVHLPRPCALVSHRLPRHLRVVRARNSFRPALTNYPMSSTTP